ncbi:MAG TPA: hopanoid biosynthesis-associated protein HpnK [Steroidobacteraceae bacterium]|jgi:hopanoid biosynthesis associated protein HpnK
MDKFLIVTADDFGLHEAVNEAVEKAARAGALTAASLMVSAPAAADAVRRARMLPRLRVGLHLTLADGQAELLPEAIPHLVDGSGRFGGRGGPRGLAHEGFRWFARPAVRRELAAEIRAQFRAFEGTGLLLDHVNAHKHLHLHPTVLGLILEIGREFGMRAVRLPSEPLWFAARYGAIRRGTRAAAGVPISSALAAAGLAPWLALMRSRLDAAGLRYNAQVFGVAASGTMDEAALLAILERLPQGATEIYLHPATHSGETIAPSMAGYRHADELAALLSPRVATAIALCGAERGGFLDLAVRGKLFPRGGPNRGSFS